MGNKCKLCGGNNGDAPCAYPEARKCLKVQQEINELKAHVERLRELLILTIKHWDNDDNPIELQSFVSELNAVLDGSQVQSLRHIESRVEEETIRGFAEYTVMQLEGLASEHAMREIYRIAERKPRKYSNQPETAAKDGE